MVTSPGAPRGGRAGVGLTGVLVLAALAAGCSGSSGGSGRDDRARVTGAIATFGSRLVSLHDIASVPGAVVGDCQSAGWAAVSWSAPLTQHTTDPLEQENNVIGVAGTGPLRLDTVRILNPPAPQEPAAVYASKDGRTQLTLTVPGQRSARIDGFLACRPAGN
jgi:hypothetical protein